VISTGFPIFWNLSFASDFATFQNFTLDLTLSDKRYGNVFEFSAIRAVSVLNIIQIFPPQPWFVSHRQLNCLQTNIYCK